MTALAFDQAESFMLVEIDGDTLSFQAVSRTGATVDSGSFAMANAFRSLTVNFTHLSAVYDSFSASTLTVAKLGSAAPWSRAPTALSSRR